jgi:NADH:ubiquinone reductase (H+-translocating)
VAVVAHWAIAFLGRGRPQRVITAQQVFARLALEAQGGAIPAPPRPIPAAREDARAS